MSFVCFYFFVRGRGPSLPLSVRSSTTDIFQSFDTPKENLLYMHVILALLSSSWVQKKNLKREGKYEWGKSISPPPKCLDAHFLFFVGARPPAELTKWKWGPFFSYSQWRGRCCLDLLLVFVLLSSPWPQMKWNRPEGGHDRNTALFLFKICLNCNAQLELVRVGKMQVSITFLSNKQKSNAYGKRWWGTWHGLPCCLALEIILNERQTGNWIGLNAIVESQWHWPRNTETQSRPLTAYLNLNRAQVTSSLVPLSTFIKAWKGRDTRHFKYFSPCLNVMFFLVVVAYTTWLAYVGS